MGGKEPRGGFPRGTEWNRLPELPLPEERRQLLGVVQYRPVRPVGLGDVEVFVEGKRVGARERRRPFGATELAAVARLHAFEGHEARRVVAVGVERDPRGEVPRKHLGRSGHQEEDLVKPVLLNVGRRFFYFALCPRGVSCSGVRRRTSTLFVERGLVFCPLSLNRRSEGTCASA